MGFFKRHYSEGTTPPARIRQTFRGEVADTVWLDEVACCTAPTGEPIPEHYESCPKHGKPVKNDR